ncbi:hypothetical protein [Ensifer aridi]|uniref:hypothetical protein n=1 Tax=Ensifer aridi TaxID=1708715 RepID=UPI000A108170|nr:hypothetical protein [Ensifer aridi]
MTTDGANGSRDRKGRFTIPGKPKRARSQTTLAIEKLLGNVATRLTRKAIKAALAGDSAALELCMDQIAPVRAPLLIPLA